jgi:glycosyltransferase involved in cell wall biosynthesis
LASRAYRQFSESLRSASRPVLYFYWGDNLCWLIPYIKTKHPEVKIVMRLHGSDLYENIKSNYAPLRNIIFSKANIIFTVSENGQKYLQAKYSAHTDKIRVARLGVFDHGLNPGADSTINIVSVSNLVPLKRVYLIFEACCKINKSLTWHHFGHGPLMNEMVEMVKAAPAHLKVILHGFVSNDKIINFYESQHVNFFVNVSTSEGVPVSIMEALSFGIPVIATDVGGTSELVNEINGKLLKADLNANELATAMAYFLNSTEEETQFRRQKARAQFLERASAEKNYNEFYQLISQLK